MSKLAFDYSKWDNIEISDDQRQLFNQIAQGIAKVWEFVPSTEHKLAAVATLEMMSEALDIIDANGLPRLHEMMWWYEAVMD